MGPNRKHWNEQQKALRQALTRSDDHQAAMALFLNQHAMVHAAEMSQSDLPSFADEVWDGLTEENFRRIPKNCEDSIAWHIWHLARIEDMTMNVLVAGEAQLLHQDNWLACTKSPVEDSGNVMSKDEIAEFSAAVDMEALRAYRMAVGQKTREIVQELAQEDLGRKIEPARLQRLMDEGAVLEGAREIVDYWGRRTVAGLLLMPPTRHNLVHINKALRLKRRRQ
jgi:hypothetical protein